MTSLIDRMSIPGGRRSGGRRSSASARSSASPYQKPASLGAEGEWKHDMFSAHENIKGGSLAARMRDKQRPGTLDTNSTLLGRAMQQATASSSMSVLPSRELAIQGASSRKVVVEGLVEGTTAADVEAIFKACGPIKSSKEFKANDGVRVEIVFKNDKDSEAAVKRFDGQAADGRKLRVTVKQGGSGLTERLGGQQSAANSGQDMVNGILGSDESSKLRSDSIMQDDPRAQVLRVPPGQKEDMGRGGPRGRGRGRGGRGGRRGGGRQRDGGMDID